MPNYAKQLHDLIHEYAKQGYSYKEIAYKADTHQSIICKLFQSPDYVNKQGYSPLSEEVIQQAIERLSK
jgi:hypothetical protein